MTLSSPPKRNISLGLIAAIIVIVVLALGFAVYYFQTSSTISSLNNRISSDSNQISVQNANLSALRNNMTAAENQISSDRSQMTGLQSRISADNATLSILKKQNSTDQNMINLLKTNITSYQLQLATLKNQVINITGLLNLKDSQIETTSVTMNPKVNQYSMVGSTFSTAYPGYVLVTVEGSFNPSDVVVWVWNNVSSVIKGSYGSYGIAFYTSTDPDSLAFAVVPGEATVYLVVNQTGITPSVSVTYYY